MCFISPAGCNLDSTSFALCAGRLRQQFPGAVLASLGWTVVTFGFSIYVTYFNGFSMYGSLTTIVILLIWLYVCMSLVLVGAYINKILVDKELEID